MGKVTASITVTRVCQFGEEHDIDVEVESEIEDFGSANPFERGLNIGDWEVTEPKGFTLTEQEQRRAEDALYANI